MVVLFVRKAEEPSLLQSEARGANGTTDRPKLRPDSTKRHSLPFSAVHSNANPYRWTDWRLGNADLYG